MKPMEGVLSRIQEEMARRGLTLPEASSTILTADLRSRIPVLAMLEEAQIRRVLCPRCDGLGWIAWPRTDDPAAMPPPLECPTCHTLGLRCPACLGNKHVRRKEYTAGLGDVPSAGDAIPCPDCPSDYDLRTALSRYFEQCVQERLDAAAAAPSEMDAGEVAVA